MTRRLRSAVLTRPHSQVCFTLWPIAVCAMAYPGKRFRRPQAQT